MHEWMYIIKCDTGRNVKLKYRERTSIYITLVAMYVELFHPGLCELTEHIIAHKPHMAIIVIKSIAWAHFESLLQSRVINNATKICRLAMYWLLFEGLAICGYTFEIQTQQWTIKSVKKTQHITVRLTVVFDDTNDQKPRASTSHASMFNNIASIRYVIAACVISTAIIKYSTISSEWLLMFYNLHHWCGNA